MRGLSVILSIVLLAGCVRAAEGGPAHPAPFVGVGRVVAADDTETRRYTGHVTSSSSVSLVARVSGEIVEVGFKEGEFVRKGQVLCVLDPIRYEADVKNAEAKVAENRARLAYAEKTLNRASELYRQKAVSQDYADSSESDHDAYQAALLAAEAQLITARDDLKNTRIVAPIDGKIGVTNYTFGNYLTPNSGVIATIIQVDPLRVRFAMSNKDFLDMFGTEETLKEKAAIVLRLANGGTYEHRGVVEFIDNQANHKTDTIQVYARFDNPEGKLIPNSTVTVLLAKDNGRTMPAVLPSAIMHDNKAAYVYVVDGENRVERRDVVLGPGTGSSQLVKSGLAVGELVIVDGSHKAMPGMKVETEMTGEHLSLGKDKDGKSASNL